MLGLIGKTRHSNSIYLKLMAETELLAAARRGDFAEVTAYSGIDVATMDEILVRTAFNGHLKLVEWCLAKYTPRKEVTERAWRYAQLGGHTEIMVLL